EIRNELRAGVRALAFGAMRNAVRELGLEVARVEPRERPRDDFGTGRSLSAPAALRHRLDTPASASGSCVNLRESTILLRRAARPRCAARQGKACSTCRAGCGGALPPGRACQ